MRCVVILAASAVLAACATAQPEATPVAAAAIATPAPTAGLDWFFHEDGDWAALAYGVAESDDVRLHLSCERGAGSVEITRPSPAGASPEIQLQSGDVAVRFPAEAEPSQLTEGDLLIARAKAAEPVFREFERTLWMAARTGEERETYVPHPGSTDGVGAFFGFCR